jgi:hypothetical protein
MKLAAITRSLQADMQAELRDLERATAVGTKESGRGLIPRDGDVINDEGDTVARRPTVSETLADRPVRRSRHDRQPRRQLGS